ncbi:4-diphosphocytidyl-2-C-methyl-D-erythritol kinase [Clostridium sp. CAG:1013]|jgi:4-diphosphocytidyl-2-C-methyl-D-erythritol kinase|nr:4-diphosphocytidyl-2-C-methyl-D-erythritol kinase [Clostridium sp. CAG:1013]
MKLKAFAKINLTLDITGRREDGYHTLDTVMQNVSVWDEIEIKKINKPGIRLFCNREYLPVDTKNTAFRAAQYFFQHCGITGQGLSINIRKYIPSRAGMGGGSADAAAVLHGLNRMFKANLPLETLVELGAKVGADVPFCVAGGTCRCKGIGEQVEKAPAMPDCWLVLCKPPAGMSTPRAYALIDQFPISRAQATDKMVSLLSGGDLRRIGEGLANRFDETMKLQQVREIKRVMLGSGAYGASMTGSGSAVFGIFDSEETARACSQQLEGKGRLYMAHPLDHGWEFIPDK